MRAIVRDTYGPPDVLELGEADKPELTDDGVLVRVRAASINAADWYALMGTPYVARMQMGLRKPKSNILGVDFAGTVEAVGLRSTRVRSLNGELVAIPNKTVGNAAIVNISRRPFIKTVLTVSLDSSLPAAKVKRALAILEESYRGHAMTRDVNVSFNQFVVHNLNVLVLHWWKGTDYAAYLAGLQQMNVAVKERFDEEGIKLGS